MAQSPRLPVLPTPLPWDRVSGQAAGGPPVCPHNELNKEDKGQREKTLRRAAGSDAASGARRAAVWATLCLGAGRGRGRRGPWAESLPWRLRPRPRRWAAAASHAYYCPRLTLLPGGASPSRGQVPRAQGAFLVLRLPSPSARGRPARGAESHAGGWRGASDSPEHGTLVPSAGRHGARRAGPRLPASLSPAPRPPVFSCVPQGVAKPPMVGTQSVWL